MDLSQLAQMCIEGPKAEQHAAALVRLAMVATDEQPWHVLDVSKGEEYTPRSLEQADQIAHALLRAGHEVRVGIALVPARAVIEQGLPLSVLWDPCSNLAMAAEQLALAPKKARPRHISRAVWQLASYLSPDAPLEGVLFATQVLEHPGPAAFGHSQGREFSLEPSTRMRVELDQKEQNQEPLQPDATLKIRLAPQPQALPTSSQDGPATLSDETLDSAAPQQPSSEPVFESEPLQAAPKKVKPVATPTPSVRKPQPDVTQERLPLSSHPVQ
jgi:hypothetical protein